MPVFSRLFEKHTPARYLLAMLVVLHGHWP